jgi:hypothetical protein
MMFGLVGEIDEKFLFILLLVSGPHRSQGGCSIFHQKSILWQRVNYFILSLFLLQGKALIII